MAILYFSNSAPSLSLLPLRKSLPGPCDPKLKPYISIFSRFSTMASISGSDSVGPSSAAIDEVPETGADQMDRIFDLTFRRYSSSSSSPAKRNGNGVAIVWFRNDLRVLDNEALYKAWISSREVLPVYCVDPRLFGSTYYFGFPKTGGISSVFCTYGVCLGEIVALFGKFWSIFLFFSFGKKPENMAILFCGIIGQFRTFTTFIDKNRVWKFIKWKEW